MRAGTWERNLVRHGGWDGEDRAEALLVELLAGAREDRCDALEGFLVTATGAVSARHAQRFTETGPASTRRQSESGA